MTGPVLVRLTDADLLDRARGGDESAFTELYTRHREVARRMAATYCRPDEADDLVDLAFERVLGALRRGRGPSDAFRSYLFVTLRRLAAEQAQRSRERPFREVPDAVAAGTAMPGLDAAEREIVTRAFESLSGRWQTVLWHTAVEGRHPRELAGWLGTSANGVSALAYRAREKLRQAYLQAHLQAAPRPECEPYRSSLGAYVREGQSRRERRATREHLGRCPSCQALVTELADVNRLLARAVLPIFLAGSSGRIAARLSGGLGAASEASRRLKRPVLGWARPNPVPVLGVAVTSAVLLLATDPLPHRDGRDPIPPAVGSTAPATTEAPGATVQLAADAEASGPAPCPAADEGQSAETSATATETSAGPLEAVLSPVLASLTGSTGTPQGEPADPFDGPCTPPEPAPDDSVVVAVDAGGTAPDEQDGTLDITTGDPLPVQTDVTAELPRGARVELGGGSAVACEQAEDGRVVTCTVETPVPTAGALPPLPPLETDAEGAGLPLVD